MTSVLITDVAVFTGTDPAQHLSVGYVSVRDGRIAALGSLQDAPNPGDFEHVLSLPGATIMPGLIDSHAHFTLDADDENRPRRHNAEGDVATTLAAAARARRALAAGITTVRDCMTTTRGIFDLRTAIERGHTSGPRMYLSGRGISAVGGHMQPIARQVSGVEDIRLAVREQFRDGADFIKLCIDASSAVGHGSRPILQLSLDEVSAAVELAHQLGRRVAAHAVTTLGIEAALDAGVDSIEHGTHLTPELAERMVAQGAVHVPTLSVHSAFRTHLEETGQFDDPQFARSGEVLAQGMAAIAVSRAAGVTIACGSDAGSPFNQLWNLSHEMRLMVDAGMTPGEVLVAATSTGAELIGIQHVVGAVTPGLEADLLVVQGDPTTDIAAVGRPLAVLKAGQLVRHDH